MAVGSRTAGGHRLVHRHGARSRFVVDLDHRGDQAPPAERRRHRGAGAGRRPRGRRALRRRHDHRDACERAVAGGAGGRAGPPGTEPARRAGSAHGSAPRRGWCRCSRRGHRGGRRPPARGHRGGRPGGWTAAVVGCVGRVRTLRGTASGRTPRRRRRPQRCGQRGAADRPGRDGRGRGVHLRRCGAAGRAGAGLVGAVRPDRGPVRGPVRPDDARPCHRGLGTELGCRPRRRCPGRGDTMPAAARGADRDHVRPVPGGAHRCGHQGRRGT